MSTEQLGKASWALYFDQLSKALKSVRAEVRVSSLKLGSQVEAKGQRLNGITYDKKDDIFVIALTGLEHIIHNPKQAYAESEDGLLRGLEITDADGVKCLVQFRQPVQLNASGKPDIVDEAGEASFPASDPPSWAGR
ncbi:MAG: DUF5335 family protein [Rhodospirillales bacterium]|nr:DUF5335 family protein [Rhodospirillales bacterium]